MLFYNRDMFAAVGLDPDAPPATFADLNAAARKLTRFEGEKLAVVPFDFSDVGTYGPLAWVYAGGSEFLSPDGREARYAQAPAVNTLSFVRDLIATHMRGPQNIVGGTNAFIE